MSNSTYCSLPFNHLNIKQKGRVSSCWRTSAEIGNLNTQSLDQIWNDAPIRELRRQFLNGEKPKQCESCWDMEAAGIRSTRLGELEDKANITYEQAKEQINSNYEMDTNNLTIIEVRFDNMCNLMCRHCSPVYSSKWENVLKNDPELLAISDRLGNNQTGWDKQFRLTQDTIDEIGQFKNLEQIMISGGEPLFHNKHYGFLENLLPIAHNLEMSYSTNLSLLHYKKHSIVELWKKFRVLDLRISMDGDDWCYNYARPFGKLSIIEDNIKTVTSELNNAHISCSCTTNLFNITRIPQIFEYFNSLGAYIHCSLVQEPFALNPQALPAQLKEQVNKDWEEWLPTARDTFKKANNSLDIDKQVKLATKWGDYVIDYMNGKDLYEEYWSDFVIYANAQDKYHNTNILDIYPEYARYWDNGPIS